MNEKNIKSNFHILKKRFSSINFKNSSYKLFHSPQKKGKNFPVEDLSKNESYKKQRNNNSLKRKTLKNMDIFFIKKISEYYPKIERLDNLIDLKYLYNFERTTYEKLINKYDNKIKKKFDFLKKEEYINKYDNNQILNLMEKKRCRIFSQLKDLYYLNNTQEYLKNIYNYKQSIIILKYLLFFIYDKDLITYIDNRNNLKYRKTIILKYNKLRSFIFAKNKIKKLILNRSQTFKNINKIFKKDKNEINDLVNINNKILDYNFSNVKNFFIYDVPISKIHSCIPNLFPNEYKLFNILKEHINIRKNQKIFKNNIHLLNKNYNIIKESKTTNTNNNINSQLYILYNSSSSLIVDDLNDEYGQNNYSINYHPYNYNRREKKDLEIYDIEKLIKNISSEQQKLKNNIELNSSKRNNKKGILKIQKKLLSHKKILKFPKSHSNISRTNEKFHISQNSTSLSNRNKFEKNDKNKEKEGNIYMPKYSLSQKILPYEEKIKKYRYTFNKINNYSLKKKSLSSESTSLSKNLFKRNSSARKSKYKLLSPNIKKDRINEINNIKQKNINNKNAIKILKVNNLKQNKYFFKETYEFTPPKKNLILIKHNWSKLKEFIKMKESLNNYNYKYNNDLNYDIDKKDSNYDTKNNHFNNKSVKDLDKGEHYHIQAKIEDTSKKIFRKIKKNYIQSKNDLKNSTTLKQIVKCGNIYEDNFF